MLNLSRGTGIRGLSGISNKAGHIVRPLLFATRADIEHYINEKKLPYRIDASNDDTSIKRNKVRHQLLPLFEELNPSFRNNLQKTIHYLKQTEIIYAERIKQIRNDIVINKQGVVRIDIDKLKKQVAGNTILYELLLPYGFNSDVACEIFHALDGRSGAKFYSDCYRAVIDRNAILLTRIPQNDNQIFYISDDQSKITEPLQLDFDIEYVNEKTKISGVSKIAMLDYDKLSFPLILRKWRRGEYFKPLGMNGLKKISDFFIDQKISIPEKENTWILYSGNQVVWIIGHRIDDRFKISPATRKIFKITVE
jgi:tRNA(Ile)-lysidine synthase